MKPKIWEHKETKKRVRVMPWWEIPEDFLDGIGLASALQKEKEKDDFKERAIKIGALVQIGWFLENEHGVWLGVGPSAKESFTEINEREGS